MTGMKKRLMAAVFLFGSTVTVSAFAHGKHVHGETEMAVALDGNELEIGISGPLSNFLGFEHAPKGEKQQKALTDMTVNLQYGDRLFAINPEAACSFVSGKVSVRKGNKTVSPTMLHALSSSKPDGHVDLDATYAFSCKNPDVLKSIKVQFFSRFPGIEEIDARVLLPKKQMAAELTAKKPFISW